MKTCTKCHIEKRDSEFGADRRKPDKLMARCKSCRKAANTAWRKAQPDYERRRYAERKEETQERHLKRKYGITLADYAAMLEQQGGKCAICGKPEPEHKKLDVDHCHKTKVVRGLLCTSCNRVLGHAWDSPERLRAAADYLASSRRLRLKSSAPSDPSKNPNPSNQPQRKPSPKIGRASCRERVLLIV